ncbi:DUF1707 domain-containing protein [Herbidospora sp. NEAU-GS84]|uniref:DUF1707 domain-containing protein n=1 Tax=Herbidospora solisilvae TaxID=2696284 RepID=A0A7C9ND97_9ACTN|nr:DUF1707 domain-containing protein [Herbidospora solisilvae]NAS21635.1 DUF1707 domain-containing protein [Herbidospora solisilvae]
MTADRLPPMVPAAAMRIGDKERDEVTVFLHDAFAQGRLTREELDERLDVTLAARTAGDLGAVLADLPGGQGVGAPPAPKAQTPPGIDMGNWGYHLARPPHARMRRGPGIGPFVPLIVGALIAMILVGGVFTVFKVLFFLWIVSLVVGAATRHHHGRRTPTRFR